MFLLLYLWNAILKKKWEQWLENIDYKTTGKQAGSNTIHRGTITKIPEKNLERNTTYWLLTDLKN